MWRDDGLVQFLNGESLMVEKEYLNVQSVSVEDYDGSGERSVVLEMHYGDKIVTDGVHETIIREDLDIMEVSDEVMENNDVVNNVLAKRLEHVNEAIASMKTEVEMKQRNLEECLNSLYLECSMDKELVIGTAGGGHQEEKTEDLVIQDHWIRIVDGKQLVLGFSLISKIDASDVSLHLLPSEQSQCHLDYQWRLVQFSAPGSLSTLYSLSSNQTASVVAVLSSTASLSIKSLRAGVSYSSQDETKKISNTISVEFKPDIYFNESLSLKFARDSSEESFLSLSVTGVTEKMIITTELGDITNLPSALENNDFKKNDVLSCHVFEQPGHVLHLSVVRIIISNSQQCEVDITVRDYSQAVQLMKIIKSLLPLDATVRRC